MSAFVDVDYDGHQDLITASCNIISVENDTITGAPVFEAISGPIRLLRNTFGETGEVSFTDATEAVFGELDDGLWMGIAMADINSDGRIDFYIGQTGDTAKNEQHLLLVSAPDGTYRNESLSRGVAWHEFNWGTDFVDLNNDGAPDLITVGIETASIWLDLINPGVIFVNDGEGNFSRAESDLGLGNARCSGLATADFNEDGSQDVMVVCATQDTGPFAEILTDPGQLHLYEGVADGNRHISFQLEGSESNRQAVGAFVQVCVNGEAPGNGNPKACQQRAINIGSSFASTHSPILHFGVPEPAVLVDVEVIWPSGSRDAFQDVSIGTRYFIQEGGDMIEIQTL